MPSQEGSTGIKVKIDTPLNFAGDRIPLKITLKKTMKELSNSITFLGGTMIGKTKDHDVATQPINTKFKTKQSIEDTVHRSQITGNAMMII